MLGDTVLSQGEAKYDAGGNVTFSIRKERFHNASGTGALGTPTAEPLARHYYVGSWFDKADRTTHSVSYETNGGTVLTTRPASLPNATDPPLVTAITYNASGWTENVTDPRGIVRRSEYDHAGRTKKTIEHYTNGTPTATSNRTTEYTYDGSDHVLTLKAVLPGTPNQQTTQYVYGASLAAGDDLNSNELLVLTMHPDKTTGQPSTAANQQEWFVYNRLGQPKKAHYDRNGTYHDYTFDVVGRPTTDSLSLIGTDVDSAVQRLATAYDTAGRPYLFTSYDAATGGSVVNEVQRDYNGFGQLTKEYQAHAGAVNTGSTPKVQYAYSEMASSANHSRPTSLTYPDGRLVQYTYATGLDNTVSRLSSLTNSSTIYEQYAYLGLGTVVKRTRVQGQSDIGLTYVKQSGEPNGDAGDPYTGLDRFGRIVDQRWLDSATPTDPLARFGYGYDRNSNRLYRENLSGTTPNHNFDELYHRNGEVTTGYDNFNQLLAFGRGPLNGAKDSISTPTYYQKWTTDANWATNTGTSTLDVQGNWTSVNTNGTVQTRSHNAQNQTTAVSGQTSPLYDNNGAMTTDQTGKTLTYDAWGRVVRVVNGGTYTYAYDALGRRVKETNGTTKDFYYSAQWQLLEERHGGAVKMQYLWSPVYVDALILRDRDAAGGSDLEERLYAVQDANWNVVAVTTPSGNVQERYVYEPYGTPTRLTASWGTAGSDTLNWVYLHQGGRYEAATGYYHFRHRDLSPALGRWIVPDPMGFGAGDTNFYRYVTNSPFVRVDPLGLDDMCCGPKVTDWFMKEIELFRGEARKILQAHKQALAAAEQYGENPSALIIPFLSQYARLARLPDYKKRNKANVEPFDYSQCADPDKNTVTLCGVCVGTNQLGNIIFGIIAVEADLVQRSRDFGLGRNPLGGLVPPWTGKDEGYRQFAFELGVDYERAYVRGSQPDLCGYVKDRADGITGGESLADMKQPCENKHTGPNTDMKRDPLTDSTGN